MDSSAYAQYNSLSSNERKRRMAEVYRRLMCIPCILLSFPTKNNLFHYCGIQEWLARAHDCGRDRGPINLNIHTYVPIALSRVNS